MQNAQKKLMRIVCAFHYGTPFVDVTTKLTVIQVVQLVQALKNSPKENVIDYLSLDIKN